MQQPDTHWPPGVGDAARVKETGLVGTIVKTKGVHEARFRLKVLPRTTDASKGQRGEAIAAKRASRWYGLDELEPPS